jgi:hypothetical protein
MLAPPAQTLSPVATAVSAPAPPIATLASLLLDHAILARELEALVATTPSACTLTGKLASGLSLVSLSLKFFS